MTPASGRWTCRIAIFLLDTLTALAITTPAAAQGEASASVTGIVTDAQGGVLPGVTVTLRNVESGAVRTTATEDGGRYRLAGLQPGRYTLRAELDGFQPTDVANLTLTIGLAVAAEPDDGASRRPGGDDRHGAGAVVETTTTEVATVVTQEQIEMLPIANRQAGSLALLLPGTQLPTGTRRARPTVGAGGANANLTTSYVDGGQNQIYNSGQEFLEVPQSGIREFRVNISGVVGAVQRGRRRGADRDQERHEPVPRRGVRVLPRHEPQRDGPVREGGARHARRRRSRSTGATSTAARSAAPSCRIASTSSPRSNARRSRRR